MLDRRDVLRLAGRGSIVVAVATMLGCDDGQSSGAGDDPVASAVLAVGAQYLDDHPDEDADTLRAALGIERGEEPPVSALSTALARAVRDDFAAGRTVGVGGWILAETEAWAAALVAAERA